MIEMPHLNGPIGNAPHVLDVDEMRKLFLDHLHHLVAYWAGEEGSNVPPTQGATERLDGLAFSILSALDGCSLAVPGYALVPLSDPEDMEFHRQNDENWYPEGTDIGGALHEQWHRR